MKLLPEGRIHVHAPIAMEVGRTENVSLIASESEATLKRFDREGSPLPISDGNAVVLGTKMTAELKGNPDFDVFLQTPMTQVTFEHGGFIYWSWNVTPKVQGSKKLLTLTIDAYMHDGTYQRVKKIPITVNVAHVTLAAKAQNFIRDNWQWLWTAIFVPISVAIWQFVKTRRQSKASSDYDDLISRR